MTTIMMIQQVGVHGSIIVLQLSSLRHHQQKWWPKRMEEKRREEKVRKKSFLLVINIAARGELNFFLACLGKV